MSKEWQKNRNISQNIRKRTAQELSPISQKQYDMVKRKFQGTPQWLKAPNGNHTNLTEHQWIQVRTPNFKH